jgi:hypothetical protein
VRPVGTALGAVLVIVGAGLWVFAMPLCGCSPTGFARLMKSELGYLASTQDQYHRENGTYAGDVRELGFTTADGLVATILSASPTGWTGRMSHARISSGADCVMAWGDVLPPRTTLKQRQPTPDQPLVCDMDGWEPTQTLWQRFRWWRSD